MEARAGSFSALLQAARHRPPVGASNHLPYHPYAEVGTAGTANPQQLGGGGKGKGKGKGAPGKTVPQKATKEAQQCSPLRYLKDVARTPTRPTGNQGKESPGHTPQKGKARPEVPLIQDDDDSEDAQTQKTGKDELDSQLRDQGIGYFTTGDKVQGLWDTGKWLDAIIVARATTHNTYTIKWDVDKKTTSGYGTQDGRLRARPTVAETAAPGNEGGAPGVVRKRTARTPIAT